MKYAIILFAFLISPTAFAQNACDAIKTHIVSEHKEHPKHILFFKTTLKKNIHTEKAVDGTGKVLVKTTMRSVCSYDACNGGPFKRVVLLGGEIYKVYSGRWRKSTVTRYDLCGHKIGKEKVDDKLFYDKYNFNAIP